MLRTSVEAGLFAALLAVTESMNYRFAAKPVPIPLLLNMVASMLSIEDAFCEEINFVGDAVLRARLLQRPDQATFACAPRGEPGRNFR